MCSPEPAASFLAASCKQTCLAIVNRPIHTHGLPGSTMLLRSAFAAGGRWMAPRMGRRAHGAGAARLACL